MRHDMCLSGLVPGCAFLIMFVFLLTAVLPAPAFCADGSGAHAFSVRDMLAMERVSGAAVSPDGKQVVFVLRKTDLGNNKGRTDLWLVGMDGKNLRQLTTFPGADYNPLWSADGKDIYFITTRSGSAQVFRIPAIGGLVTQITREPLDVGNLILSPDGSKIAFSMDVFPGTTPAQTADKLEEMKNRQASGRIYDGLLFRHWDTWADGRRSHIFVMPLAGGPAVDIMKHMDSDSPLKPFGDNQEFTFTPDGNAVVFTAANSGREGAWSTNFDLFVAPTDGSGRPRSLTADNKAWDTKPVFSPDGKTMAYLAMKRPGYEADQYQIVLYNWADGGKRVLTETWDRSPRTIRWAPDGKTIYTFAPNLGQRSLFALDVKTGAVETIINEGRVMLLEIAGKKLLYGMQTLKSPTELYAVDMKRKRRKKPRKVTVVTAINADRLAKVKMGDYEQFTFKGWNDETVYCYVVRPVDFDAAKKYPVAFLIHGGPQGSFGNQFHYRWNPQAYTGAGYAVVMVDFHGSQGYGQAFCDSIGGDWGGKPLEDLQKGLAAALKRYDWMDGDRVAALGASYGGYMINWIAGNWNDRFRCLVNHDGNLDERFAYYDTEELWFPEWDHRGTPWDNPEGYAKHNPIDYVKNWKTPMLVIHGALDYRVVESQGMATFTALQRRGIPSRFLYFPDENHWVLKPHNSILWHDTVLEWLDRWTKK